MFKEWRELEKDVASTKIIEPSLDVRPGHPRATDIGVIDDDELRRLYSYYHFGELEVSEHLSGSGVGLDDHAIPEDEIFDVLNAGRAYELCRTAFYYALRRRWPELLEVNDSDIWILKGWRVIVRDIAK